MDKRLDKYLDSEARRKANAAKKKVYLSSSDYMLFCDTCFEFYIRYRDNWVDTLDGKIFRQGDFEGYHACHYISRANRSTRYLDINCHGQSQNYNFTMSNSNPNPILRRNMENKYRNFLVRKYGEDDVKALEAMNGQECKVSEYDWQVLARDLYGKAARQDSLRLEQRLLKVFRWSKDRRTLELIREKIVEVCNG